MYVLPKVTSFPPTPSVKLPKPVPAPIRMLREGGRLDRLCPICKSSLQINYVFGFIPWGLTDRCISPKCSNFYKRGK